MVQQDVVVEAVEEVAVVVEVVDAAVGGDEASVWPEAWKRERV